MKFDLFLLTARRIDLFKETIDSLFKINKDINSYINRIFILDDRSSWEDRKFMVDLISSYSLGFPVIVCFNSSVPYQWVEKFNMIGKVAESEFIFLLEDDWRSIKPINFKEVFDRMLNSDISQIALCDPIWIQKDEIKEKNKDDKFWENQFPGYFYHITHKEKDFWHWSEVSINNYTNNPSIIKTEVFKKNKFLHQKSFEDSFAQSQSNSKQLFSNDLHFEHLGKNNSLIE